MNFTHLYEMFLHQGIFHCSRCNGPKYANTEKARLDRVVIATQSLYGKLSVKTRLEHGLP